MKRWSSTSQPWKQKPSKTAAKPKAIPPKAVQPAATSAAEAAAAGVGQSSSKRRRVCAPAGHNEELDSAEKKVASARSCEATARVNSLDLLALRLRAGRTVPNLLALVSAGLFSSPAPPNQPCMKPQAGLQAYLQGQPVLIVETFTFRTLLRCDVVNLIPQHGGPEAATHTWDKRSRQTLEASALGDVGLHFAFVSTRRNMPWFRCLDPAEPPPLPCPSDVSFLSPPSRAEGRGAPVQAPLCRDIVQIIPRASQAHARDTGHTCGPRQALVAKKFVVWDFPWPVELDARPFRCVTCGNRRQGKGEGVNYFAVTAEDVQADVPDAIPIRTNRSGELYVTVRFLIQLLATLYECISFRAARRRLMDVYFANCLMVAGPEAAQTALRLRRLCVCFPDPSALADMSRLAFTDLVRSRVQAFRDLNFVYNGQSVRLDGHFKKAKIVVRYVPGTRRRHRPYSCVLGFCGTDGSLLQPVQPVRGESWADIVPILKPLLAAGLTTYNTVN